MKRPQTKAGELSPGFFERAVKTEAGCWEWSGTRNRRGYGIVQFCGRPAMAHGVAWEIHFGEIPPGLFVCHHCDNPCCVRPAHLFLGTNAHNLADMRKKGRGSPPPHMSGEEHPNHRLTAARVQEIRARYATEEVSGAALARQYGVRPYTIQLILNRRGWRTLPPVEGEIGHLVHKGRPSTRGMGNAAAVLTEDQVHEIRRRYAVNLETITLLAREYGMGVSAVRSIINRETWTHLPQLPGEASCCRSAKEAARLRGRSKP